MGYYITPNDPEVMNVSRLICGPNFGKTDFWTLRSNVENLYHWVAGSTPHGIPKHIQVMNDQQFWGVTDYWQLSNTTLAFNHGDDEDQAILLASLVGAAGAPIERVRIAQYGVYKLEFPWWGLGLISEEKERLDSYYAVEIYDISMNPINLIWHDWWTPLHPCAENMFGWPLPFSSCELVGNAVFENPVSQIRLKPEYYYYEKQADKPKARFSVSSNMPRVNETVKFDASTSTPDGGYILRHFWDFGDGTRYNVTSGGRIPPNPVYHEYRVEGNYTVGLTVFDNEGLSDNTTRLIQVRGTPDTTPPRIVIISPQNQTYTTNTITLSYFADEPLSWVGCTIDDGDYVLNTTINENTTLYFGRSGSHSIQIFANDTSRNTGSSEKVYFTTGAPPEVFIFVDSPLFGALETYLDRYIVDLRSEGVECVAREFNGTSVELRSILRDAYSRGLKGCLLVGDIPAVWYEMDSDFGHEEFPTDLFYMDLNGNWTDTDWDGKYDRHTGNRSAEIWVGRMKTSNLAESESSLLQSYFDKDHDFRTGALTLPYRALTYVDDDWGSFEANYAVGLVYDSQTLVDRKDVTNPTDYLGRLGQDWNLVQVLVHGSSDLHTFKIEGNWDGSVYSSDIRNKDPHAFFYNLFSCSNARYTDPDYIAGSYIFGRSYGLAAISSTKTGGMLYFEDFYREFRNKTLGQSFLNWLNERIETENADPDFWYSRKWYYGMTILGDPTLYSSYSSTTTSSNLQQPETVHEADLPSSVLHVSSSKGSGEYSSIQEAINAANPGDLIVVAPGIYDEHLFINKSVRIIGQESDKVFLVSNETGPLLLVTADNVEIRSLTIKALPSEGLEISQIPVKEGIIIHSNNNTIENNKIIDCDIGIQLSHCFGNNMTNNQLENCNQSGIYARHSMNSNMTGNVIANSLIGTFFFECGNTTFSGNRLENNTYVPIQYSKTDVSVLEIESAKTVLGRTQSMPVKVAVTNHGNFSAAFGVTLYANETIIGTFANVTLSSGNSTMLTFDWNTTQWSTGNYTVWAYAEPLLGETDTQDNLLVGRAIYVTIMGDINADGKVNIIDIFTTAMGFGSKIGDQRWNPNADINEDETINILDIVAIAEEFGNTL
jgi:parallel beta-helix repeat protein